MANQGKSGGKDGSTQKLRRYPLLSIDSELMSFLVGRVSSGRKVVSIEPLSGGLINSNYKVAFSDGEIVVTRVYLRGQDAFSRETGAMNLVKGILPVPRLLLSQTPTERFPYFYSIQSWIGDTRSFMSVIDGAQESDGAEVIEALAKALIALSSVRLNEEFNINFFESIERYLSDKGMNRYFSEGDINAIRELIKRYKPEIENQGREAFFHGDFRDDNILFSKASGKWEIAGLIDWEFAGNGVGFRDIATIMRKGRLYPSYFGSCFERAYLSAGGQLPGNWRNLIRIVDLERLLEVLSHPEDRGALTQACIQEIKITLQL